MQLVFGEKCKPVNAVLLVRTKLGVDCYRNLVRLDFGAVQKLRQKFALSIAALEQFFWEIRRVRKTSLEAK